MIIRKIKCWIARRKIKKYDPKFNFNNLRTAILIQEWKEKNPRKEKLKQKDLFEDL